MGEKELAELARELPVLGAVGRVLRRAVRHRFPLPVLSEPQVAVLRTVEASPGTTPGAVAQRLQLAPSTVSTLLRELRDAGLVTRREDPSDRRAVRLELTPAARERLERWGALREEVLSAALRRLPEEDLAALRGALPAVRRLAAALEQER